LPPAPNQGGANDRHDSYQKTDRLAAWPGASINQERMMLMTEKKRPSLVMIEDARDNPPSERLELLRTVDALDGSIRFAMGIQSALHGVLVGSDADALGELVDAHIGQLRTIRDGVDRMRGGKFKRIEA
jgi:hypothetical protein